MSPPPAPSLTVQCAFASHPHRTIVMCTFPRSITVPVIPATVRVHRDITYTVHPHYPGYPPGPTIALAVALAFLAVVLLARMWVQRRARQWDRAAAPAPEQPAPVYADWAEPGELARVYAEPRAPEPEWDSELAGNSRQEREPI